MRYLETIKFANQFGMGIMSTSDSLSPTTCIATPTIAPTEDDNYLAVFLDIEGICQHCHSAPLSQNSHVSDEGSLPHRTYSHQLAAAICLPVILHYKFKWSSSSCIHGYARLIALAMMHPARSSRRLPRGLSTMRTHGAPYSLCDPLGECAPLG